AGEVADADGLFGRWRRRKFELQLRGQRERAFGADEKMGKVVRLTAWYERVDIVAADAAQHFRKPGVYLRRLALPERQQVAEERAIRPIDIAHRLRAGHRAEMQRTPV